MAQIVEVKVLSSEGWEGLRKERLEIDGVEVMHVAPLSECPEDAILERDLVGPSDFASLLESFLKEHNGKNVKFVYEDEEEEE